MKSRILVMALVWLFIIKLCITQYASAQKIKVKFGKVTMEELEMSVYPADSNAEAVILYDKGEFNPNEFEFTRHLRVKILKKSGTRWGNWTINTPRRANFRIVVHNIKNGEYVVEKAKSNSIFKEEVIKGTRSYKIFAPNVTVGSVVEIKYTHRGLPREWRFQERIPVKYSELYLPPSGYMNFNKTHFGFEPIQTVGSNRWIAQDMPAFQAEPFINHYSNYITKFEIQVESFGFGSFSSSWEEISETLLESSRFGEVIKGCGFLNDYAKELKSKELSAQETILAAYDHIREQIKWNDIYRIMASDGYSVNYKKDHSGTSADINLILISLLKKVGITVYPAVLSTRDNGLILEFSPTINKLNHVIAYVKHETKNDTLEYLLDASSDKVTPGILPPNCLNGKAWVVLDKDKGSWLELNKDVISKKNQFINIVLGDDGSAVATVDQQFWNYAYLEWAEKREEDEDERKYIIDLEKEYPNITVTDYYVKKEEPNNLFVGEVFKIDLANYVLDAGNAVIFSPFLFFEYSENPFKSETRKYPVDLNFPRELSSTVIVQFPSKYKVMSMPESLQMRNPDSSAVFRFLSNTSGNRIQIQMKLQLNRSIFTEMEYLELRNFFSEVIKRVNQPLELNKNT